jgi:hypothetical protein
VKGSKKRSAAEAGIEETKREEAIKVTEADEEDEESVDKKKQAEMK